MSRSYKKTPYAGDHKGKAKKRIVNHKVRRNLNQDNTLIVPFGKYKKLYQSYNICDFGWVYTWEEYWANECNRYNNWKHRFKNVSKPDKKDADRKWCKWYRNK